MGGEPWIGGEDNPPRTELYTFGCQEMGGDCNRCLNGDCQAYMSNGYEILGNDIPRDGRDFWVLEGDDFDVPSDMQFTNGRAIYCAKKCTQFKSEGCRAFTLDGALSAESGAPQGRCYLKSGGFPYSLHDDGAQTNWVSGTTDISNELDAYHKNQHCDFKKDKDFQGGDIKSYCKGTFCNAQDMGSQTSPLPYTEIDGVTSEADCCRQCMKQSEACKNAPDTDNEDSAMECCIGGGGNHPTYTCYSKSCTGVAYDKMENACYLKDTDYTSEISRQGWSAGYMKGSGGGDDDSVCDYVEANMDYQGGDIPTYCSGTFCNPDIHGTEMNPIPYTEKDGIPNLDKCCDACKDQSKACRDAMEVQDGKMHCCLGGGGNHPTYTCYANPCSGVAYDEGAKKCYFKNKDDANQVERDGFSTAQISGVF